MFQKRIPLLLSITLALELILSGCNLVTPTPSTSLPPAASPNNLPAGSTPTIGASIPGGMQIRFLNLSDGATVVGTYDENGKPLVIVQIEVTGQAPLFVDLTANGIPALDGNKRDLEVGNTGGVIPFSVDLSWSPVNGGGGYTLVASALDNDKQGVQTTIHVMVTGIPEFTPTPPPPDRAGAQQRISELIHQEYGVTIPKPSVLRFDSPQSPGFSRWIGAAYYQGMRYYIDLYDDTTFAWSNGDYSDPAHRLNVDYWVYCRPSGNYRVLTVFVDYGNTGANREDVLAQVPVVVDMVNGLYTVFSASQGLSEQLMHIEADAVYISPPPAPGEFLTADQILTLTGKDPSSYDFLMEIDLDANATVAARYFSDILEAGGGVALQGCGTGNKYGIINIWSSIPSAAEVQGGLVMDFDHELSHMFGMMDNWPYRWGVVSPNGISLDDWIPYVLFGWTDTDGDGIPEIIDPNPYGTTNP